MPHEAIWEPEGEQEEEGARQTDREEAVRAPRPLEKHLWDLLAPLNSSNTVRQAAAGVPAGGLSERAGEAGGTDALLLFPARHRATLQSTLHQTTHDSLRPHRYLTITTSRQFS